MAVSNKILVDKIPSEFIIALGIVGSRKRNNKTDKLAVKDVIRKIDPEIIVTGDCKQGADKFARYYAKAFKKKLIVFRAHIYNSMEYHEMVKEYYRRNREIAKTSTMLVALVSKDRTGGTENTIKHFKKLRKDWEDRLILL